MARTTRATRTTSRTRRATATATRAVSARRDGLPTGGVTAAIVPVGAASTALATNADVTAELAAAAPTFGDVLLSIGTAVARSQDALDRGMVETAKQLSATKITVVTDVVQKLDDDGLPVGDDTDLITADVSLINFVTPTVHQWNHVALSMDLEVGEFDSEAGLTFRSKQASTSAVNARPAGFLGWFMSVGSKSTASTGFLFSTNGEFESDWAQGQVRLDAQLGPRATQKFPVPAEVTIGPSIFFAQGGTTETKQSGKVVARAVDVVISVRKAGGDVNPNVPIVVEADAFRIAFATGGGFNGSSTNAQGQVKVTLTRDIPSEAFSRVTSRRVTARLGQVSNSMLVTL